MSSSRRSMCRTTAASSPAGAASSTSSRARSRPSGTTRSAHAVPPASNTVSSELPSRATTFGSRSATPCESSVLAKSTGSPPPPRSAKGSITPTSSRARLQDGSDPFKVAGEMVHLLPEGAELSDARALVKAHVDVTAGRIRAGTSTFYDTFDGRLHSGGVTLRHSGGKLTLTERATGETLATAEAPARAQQRLFDHDLAESLEAHLADAIEMRALTPVAK